MTQVCPIPRASAARTHLCERVPELVNLLVSMGGRIHEVRSGRSSLEQRFVELVSRDRSMAGTPSTPPETVQ